MENHDRSKRRVIAESFIKSNGVLVNSDITENILSRIPVEFVSRSRAVCKLWRNHLKKPKTGFLYFTGSPDFQICYGDQFSEEEEVNISFQSLRKIDHGLGQDKFIGSIYGSCNGIVCFPDYGKEKQVYIFNPMTGEYIYLPEMDLGGISRDNMYNGFGYCISTNEYKVVQVYYEKEKDVGSLPLGRVQVYTLGGGNVWRHKGEIPYIFKEVAVFANNSLYWLDHSTELQFNNIIAFDLADETFSILPLPPCFNSVPGYYPEKRVYLVSLRGSLGVYHVNIAELSSEHALSTYDCLDIWILKKEKRKKRNYKKTKNRVNGWGPFGYCPVDENDDSNPWVWIREFSMKYESWCSDPIRYEPFAITPSNQILLWACSSVKYLFCYDPNTLTLKKLWNEYVYDAQAIPHMNSFVSLKDLGESLSQRYVLADSKLTIEGNVHVENILGSSNGLINNLNIDITENILSHIPIEFVSLGRAVCRLWRIFLKKPKTGFLFAVSEKERREEIQIFHGYSEEVNIHEEPISYKTLTKVDLGLGQSRSIPVKMIKKEPYSFNPIIFGSCNGLVCFPVRKDEMKSLVYICNPMTGEYVYLPEMDFGEISRPELFGGFGYCQYTNEYKVVQVTYEHKQLEQLGRVQVYTLGGGSGWRNKGETSYTSEERVVFANESLYWIEYIEDDWSIRAFHLADETFSTIPMPLSHDVRGYKRLVSLNGCLCLYHVTYEKCVEDEEDPNIRDEEKRMASMDMWILKKEQTKKKNVDENDDSNPWVWTREISKQYKIEDPYFEDYEPFSITNNNQVLMWETCDLFAHKAPVCYDPNTGSTNNLWDTSVLYGQAIPHMNSFVSLEDLGEKSAWYIPDDSKFICTSQKV